MLSYVQIIILGMSLPPLEHVPSSYIHISTKTSFCTLWEEWEHSMSMLIYLDNLFLPVLPFYLRLNAYSWDAHNCLEKMYCKQACS